MPRFTERLQHAWNAFLNKDPPGAYYQVGSSSSYRPDRARLTRGNERSIISSVYTRIAIDCAAIKINHARTDGNGNFVDIINSGLNECLTVSANTDQTGRAFMQDVVMSLLDEGCVAIVPTDTSVSPRFSNSFDILSMRVGKVIEWYPKHVKVNLYNEATGLKEDIVLPKSSVAIVENPLYAVMNEHNSTLQRLIRKLNILDAIDEQSGAGKLDLIIQLPYIVKSPARKAQAEARRAEIEEQLAGSKYGIAYTDGTEKVQQLNRSVENHLLDQITYLTEQLYGQLGMSEDIFKGTADDKAMLKYYNGTIEPILAAIVDEMKRKFLTKTARTQNQSIVFYRDPFKLVSINEIADIADRFTRNEILSANEVRQLIGFKPSDDPNADQLRNRNLSVSDTGVGAATSNSEQADDTGQESQNGQEDQVNDL